MAIKGLSELLEKYRKGEIADASAFEAELTKGGLYEGYIPKDKFDEKNGEAKKLKEQLEAQTKLVDELKEKGNLSDEYKNQIEKLKAENPMMWVGLMNNLRLSMPNKKCRKTPKKFCSFSAGMWVTKSSVSLLK